MATNGDVMYSVSKFADYGKLSAATWRDLRAGARVAVDEAKRDPLDFVLWKQAKPGEPHWAVALGRGPSRLAHRVLGDVVRPARTETSTFTAAAWISSSRITRTRSRSRAQRPTGPFAHLWMHNGFVNVDNEKMSKSLGNFFRIRDVLDSGKLRDPEVLRYFLALEPLSRPDQLFARCRSSRRTRR